MDRTFKCKRCRRKKLAPKPTGRLPSTCDECRGPARSRETLDRKNARDAAKLKGSRASATAEDAHRTANLATGLALYPDDPAYAAAWAGIDPEVVNVVELAEQAGLRHEAIVAGKVEGTLGLLLALINRCTINALSHADEMAPRDAVNAIRQAASARDLLLGTARSDSFADVTVQIVSGDGPAVTTL